MGNTCIKDRLTYLKSEEGKNRFNIDNDETLFNFRKVRAHRIYQRAMCWYKEMRYKGTMTSITSHKNFKSSPKSHGKSKRTQSSMYDDDEDMEKKEQSNPNDPGVCWNFLNKELNDASNNYDELRTDDGT